jgi:hypothetical protein
MVVERLQLAAVILQSALCLFLLAAVVVGILALVGMGVQVAAVVLLMMALTNLAGLATLQMYRHHKEIMVV